jgi:hypothetical protein
MVAIAALVDGRRSNMMRRATPPLPILMLLGDELRKAREAQLRNADAENHSGNGDGSDRHNPPLEPVAG